MINDIINTLNVLNNAYHKTTNSKLKEYYLVFFKKLLTNTNEGFSYYEFLLKRMDFSENEINTLLSGVKKDNGYDYLVTDNIDVYRKNNDLMSVLKETFENSNYNSVSTWINNYKDFIFLNIQYFDLNKMFDYLKTIFNGKYIELLDNFRIEVYSHSYDVINIKESTSDYRSLMKDKIFSEYGIQNNDSIKKALESINRKCLINTRNKKGNIDSDYKRNRIISFLLGNWEKSNNNNIRFKPNDDNNLIKKGMGNF